MATIAESTGLTAQEINITLIVRRVVPAIQEVSRVLAEVFRSVIEAIIETITTLVRFCDTHDLIPTRNYPSTAVRPMRAQQVLPPHPFTSWGRGYWNRKR